MQTQSYSRTIAIQDELGRTSARLTFKSIKARKKYDTLLQELVKSGDLLNIEDVDYTLCISEWAERNELSRKHAVRLATQGRLHGANQLSNGAWVVPSTTRKPKKLKTGAAAHKK